MRRTSLILITICVSLVIQPIETIAQTTFEEFSKQQAISFQQFIEDDKAAFEKYKADVEQKWREFIESTQFEWVSYGQNLEGMSRVDFRAGRIVIEALVETHSEGDMDEARRKVAEQVKLLLTADNASGRNILQGQLRLLDGTPVTAENVETFAKESTVGTEKHIGHFKGKDDVDRMRVRLEIQMVPDHMQRRAELYLPLVRKYCELYDLDVATIMAIIETESTFNPMARSHAPAYGLMQIVPKSAGLEVNRLFFNLDEPPKPSFLYIPENNIRFGCAYLKSLRDRQFRNVVDPQKALYLLISAYNTGPSNVARAVTGRADISQAVQEVKKLSADSLYNHLIVNLPSQETRDYLGKVITNTDQYEGLK